MTALAWSRQPITLDQLLPGLCAGIGAVTPADLTLDSRDVSAGSVFFALPGRDSDGRRFISQALASGAAAVVAEAEGFVGSSDPRVIAVPQLRHRLADVVRTFYADPSAGMALVAVTGTNGKTSVADFVAQLLRAQGVAAGCIGTLGARLDGAVGASRNTTPDLVSLTRQLANWLDQGVDHVALEASSHALDQQRLEGVNLHTGVFTNISRDHFDYHGDEESYVRAKLRLFTEFPLKRAIYNADDPQARRTREVTQAPSLGVSLQTAEADVFVQVLNASTDLVLRLHTPWGTRELKAGLSGDFNAVNLVMAVLAVTGLGYRFDDVAHAAESLQPVAGRMQSIANDLNIRVVVDYAHTPDALARALQALRPQTAGRLWVVFGCGGDRDRGKRPQMGAVAASYADRLVVTSDNPRSEDPERIVRDIRTGIDQACEVLVDRRAAIEFAIQAALPGDTVLIAGKGHEEYQEINGRREPFSDLSEAEAVLARRSVND
jgi:UDP-N-acetylmuramyl-tripeptide synthetase